MLKQMVRFALIGMSSALVNAGVYNGMLLTMHMMGLAFAQDFLVAQIVGFAVSVLWAFLLNRRYVFNSEEERSVSWYKALLRMYVAYSVTGVGLSMLLSLAWVHLLGIPKPILPVLNDAIGFPVNFLLNKYWSFRTG